MSRDNARDYGRDECGDPIEPLIRVNHHRQPEEEEGFDEDRVREGARRITAEFFHVVEAAGGSMLLREVVESRPELAREVDEIVRQAVCEARRHDGSIRAAKARGDVGRLLSGLLSLSAEDAADSGKVALTVLRAQVDSETAEVP